MHGYILNQEQQYILNRKDECSDCFSYFLTSLIDLFTWLFYTGGWVLIDLRLAGSGGFDKIFSPKLSRHSSGQSVGLPSPANLINKSPQTSLESTVISLEETISDSQAKCNALVTELDSSESLVDHVADVKQLKEKLESMQSLLMQLRSQI